MPERRSELVISVHGIRTRGKWQKDLVPLLGDEGYISHPFDYGYFGVLPFLLRSARRRKIDAFRDELAEANRKYERCHIIAHSFGTYIVARALEINPDLRCDHFILCGSIIRRDFPWELVAKRGQVRRVLNDYGRLDVWSRLVGWWVPDAGSSGRDGFEPLADSEFLIQREHREFRHSDYFFDLNYEKRWIPFIKTGHLLAPLLTPPARVNPRYVATVTLLVLVVLLTAGYALWRPDPGPLPPGGSTGTESSVTASESDNPSGPIGTSALRTITTTTADPAPPPPLPQLVTMEGCVCTGNELAGSCECANAGTFRWPRPQGVAAVEMVACGGGGGGGQAGGAGQGEPDNAGGGGGGEGAAVYTVRLTGLTADSYRVVVGNGGLGPKATHGGTGEAGTNGGASSFGQDGNGTFGIERLGDATPAVMPLATQIVFAGGHGGQGGLQGSRGGAPGTGGTGGLGADGGAGHGPVTSATQSSTPGQRWGQADGGTGTVNCEINGTSGGSGGGGGGALGPGGNGGCGAGSGGAMPGADGGRCAGGGGGGGYGEGQRIGEAGGKGGNGYVTLRWSAQQVRR